MFGLSKAHTNHYEELKIHAKAICEKNEDKMNYEKNYSTISQKIQQTLSGWEHAKLGTPKEMLFLLLSDAFGKLKKPGDK